MSETAFNFDPNNYLVGVISDTHGLLRPEAVAALKGVNLILHAGDVHTPEVLDDLKAIAPVIAVRGNHDKGDWANKLNVIETIKIGAILICMIHDLKDLQIDLNASGFRVVICGHSHQPLIEKRNNVLFLNPGSAGKRRFKLPVTVAHLSIAGTNVKVKIIDILENNQPINI